MMHLWHVRSLTAVAAFVGTLTVYSMTVAATPALTLPDAEFLQDREELSWVIAAQGNRAQHAIRAELVLGLRQMRAPPLPAYEVEVRAESGRDGSAT